MNEEDAAWVRSHFDAVDRLAAESEAFRFALEAVIDWRFAIDARAIIARLWSGIEAIFGINSELVFRVSLISARLLADNLADRRAKFETVKKLYDLRSKAVHGSAMSPDKLKIAINESFRLLRDLLVLVAERGEMLTKADIEDALLG